MRFIKALGALIFLGMLVVGPPWGLIHFFGNPWPDEGVSLSAPLTDGAIIGLLVVIVWILWAQLMVCIATEAVAALTADRIRIRAPFTFGLQQQMARRLVTAIVVATVSTPVGVGAAMADTGQTPATSTATQSTVTTSQHASTATTEAAQGSAAEQASTNVVTVMRLDSLWSIAERHLGDGDRWPEIAALNEGQTMNDGAKFLASDHIKPGWELRMPSDAKNATPASAPTSTPQHEVKVDKGDTLSEIAAEQLGDANAYPELFEANKDAVQPGGSRLVDPDLIQPGWTITIPDHADNDKTAIRPPAQDPTEQSAPEQSAPEDTAPEDTAPAPSTTDEGQAEEQGSGGDVPSQEPAPAETPQAPTDEEPAQAPTDVPTEPPTEAAPPTTDSGSEEDGAEDTSSTDAEQDESEGEEAGWPVMNIGGVGALLAAAVIGLLAFRRSRQRRVRQPGQQVPLPSAEAEAVETEVRAVADEVGLDSIDHTLRTLAGVCDRDGIPRPRLRLVRFVAGKVDYYFVDNVELPAPWEATSDPTVWTLPENADLTQHENSASTTAPWPALATMGQDSEEGLILVNLAEAGTFGIVGEAPHVRDAITALAMELGTAPWAADLDLVTVGSLAELGDILEPGRLQYVPVPELATTVDDAGDTGDVPSRTRLVIDAAGMISREYHDQLRESGALVITQGWFAGNTALEVTASDQAKLLPYHVSLVPQLIDQRTYEGLIESLATSLEDPEAPDGPDAGSVLPFAEVPSTSEPPDSFLADRLGGRDAEDGEEASERTVERPSYATLTQAQLSSEYVASFSPAEESPATSSPARDVPADVDQLAGERVDDQVHTGAGFAIFADIDEDDAPAVSSETTEAAPEISADVATETEQQDVTTVLEERTPDAEEDVVDLELDDAASSTSGDVPAEQLDEAEPTSDVEISPETDTAADADADASANDEVEADSAELEPLALAPDNDQTPAVLKTGHPVIRILAPRVDVIETAGVAPASTHLPVCTRVAAYLVLNPDSTRPALANAVWGGRRISANTINSRISNVRKWLGHNPTTGAKYFPERTLRLEDTVVTDWEVFKNLVGDKTATASTTALEEALSLVRGRPFEGYAEDDEAREWAFTEFQQIRIYEAIVDVAYELARRRYFEGAWRKACQAAASGVLFEPSAERLWRIWIHAEHANGRPNRVQEAISRMKARITELDPDHGPVDLEPETVQLIDAIAEHDAAGVEHSRNAL